MIACWLVMLVLTGFSRVGLTGMDWFKQEACPTQSP